MDNCEKILIEGLAALRIKTQSTQLEKLLAFITLLVKWNKAYNLTSIREPDKIAPLHILDSLAVYPYLQGERVLDVGTGAGLPGIPLAIFYPEKKFVLLDSNAKKTRFVQQVMVELKLDNVRIQHDRVEKFTPDILFDTVMCRAFSSMEDILSLTAHLLLKSGRLLAMKGKIPTEKLKDRFEVIPLTIPFIDAERCLIRVIPND